MANLAEVLKELRQERSALDHAIEHRRFSPDEV
jgi:hypothetical protein